MGSGSGRSAFLLARRPDLERSWPFVHDRLVARLACQQYCDDPGFVSGELGTKRIGVVGLGQIGALVVGVTRAHALTPAAIAARTGTSLPSGLSVPVEAAGEDE